MVYKAPRAAWASTKPPLRSERWTESPRPQTATSADNATPIPPPRRAPPLCAARRPRRKHASHTRGTRPQPRRQWPAVTSTTSRTYEQGGHTHAARATTPRLAYSQSGGLFCTQRIHTPPPPRSHHTGPTPAYTKYTTTSHQSRTRVQGLERGGNKYKRQTPIKNIFFQGTVPVFGISTRELPVHSKESLRLVRLYLEYTNRKKMAAVGIQIAVGFAFVISGVVSEKIRGFL